ncbi:MAG: hypothetical protein HY810_04775 [Candidatus Omnitrophica bacterium]|nr:hypothetical protein [Candidatus Omnitrophota bacterium]
MSEKKIDFKEKINKIIGKRFSGKETKILAIIAVILIFALYCFFLEFISQFKTETKVVENLMLPDVNVSKLSVPQVKINDKTNVSEEVIIKETDIRDPFLPSKNVDQINTNIVEKELPIDLKVSGILWDNDVPTAIINSKVVKIGDLIYGKTVVDMEKDKVILMDEGQIYIMPLRK